MHTYKRLPVTFERGEGCWLWDKEGKRYLDALAGIAVVGIGHSHPRFVQTLTAQAARLVHTSNVYEIENQEALGARLAAISGMDEVFFCNSGCEANEAALKIARLYGHHKGIEMPAIIVMEKAFHGRTIATLSATGSRKVQAGFEPLVPGFARVPFDDFAAIKKVAESNRNVVAVLVELIQGEGGINICHPEYLHGLREICDANGWLLMLDEVQCGMGRTGKWFAHQWAGIKPDVMPLAKGLGSGVPVGALVCGPKAANVFGPGNHGTTFGGNPVASIAGLAVLTVIERDGLLAQVNAVGNHLASSIIALDHPMIAGVRGRGMLLAIELTEPVSDQVAALALEAGFVINNPIPNALRLAPPYILSKADADSFVAALPGLLDKVEV
jgi:acetylornithine aminotransferase